MLKHGFDPKAGLFRAGADGALYPNPAAVHLVSEPHARFEFMGSMLAKALYEGILVELINDSLMTN